MNAKQLKRQRYLAKRAARREEAMTAAMKERAGLASTLFVRRVHAIDGDVIPEQNLVMPTRQLKPWKD